MTFTNLVLFLISLFILVKSTGYCINYSARIAKIFRLSEFIVSFFIVAIVSVLPEATMSIISAVKGVPEFGLGTLFGSNVTDLTLVFGIVAIFSYSGIRVKSEILKKNFFYLLLLLMPLLLGIDGHFSRIDGLLLVIGGGVFFLTLSIESKMFSKPFNNLMNRSLFKNAALLIAAMAVLLISAYYTVKFGVGFANAIRIPPALIGLTVVAIGTCLPELVFSLKAIKTKHDSLVLGDILGTVITDATIILGIVALVHPFYFDTSMIYITGVMMFLAGFVTILFIRSGKVLSKKEGVILLLFYIAYLIIEFTVRSAI